MIAFGNNIVTEKTANNAPRHSEIMLSPFCAITEANNWRLQSVYNDVFTGSRQMWNTM